MNSSSRMAAREGLRSLLSWRPRPSNVQLLLRGTPESYASFPAASSHMVSSMRSREFITVSSPRNLSQTSSSKAHAQLNDTAPEEVAEEPAEPVKKKRIRRTKAELQALRDAGINPKTGRPFRQKSVASRRSLREVQKQEGHAAPFTVVRDLPIEQQELIKDDPLVHSHLPLSTNWLPAFTGRHLGRKYFTNMYTFFITNKNTAKKVVDSLGLDKGGKKTVVEAYPGPGIISKEFLKHPNVEKLIMLENNAAYEPWIESLLKEKDLPLAKLLWLKSSGFKWETYGEIFREKGFDHLSDRIPLSLSSSEDAARQADAFDPSTLIPRKLHTDPDWQQECPIVFFAQLPNSIHGELLFVQIVQAIAERAWLHQLGRVQMSFVCSESIMRRITAQPGDRIHRSKIGTTTQLLADVEWHISGDELTPFKDHVFPFSGIIGLRMTKQSGWAIVNENISSGISKQALAVGTVRPKKVPMITKELWEPYEYLSRKLFVVRAQSVEAALKTAAPGADTILQRLSKENPELAADEEEIIDPSTPVCSLTNKQWVSLVRAFDFWPFKPKMLLEEGFLGMDLNRKW